MGYLWIKSLHIIAVISWMAGMLYLFRLFVNHAAETEAIVQERLQGMERRLLRAITNPAMIVTLLSGGAMLWIQPELPYSGRNRTSPTDDRPARARQSLSVAGSNCSRCRGGSR